jgi:hypothetical protein
LHVTQRIGMSILVLYPLLTIFPFHFLHLEQEMFVASRKDITAALVLLAVAVIPLVTGLPYAVLDTVQANPLFTKGVWVVIIGALVFSKYYLTALVAIVLGMIVRYEVFGSYAYSHDGILAAYADAQKRDPRFNPSVDLDLQIGEGTLHRDPARWLDKGKMREGPLLLYPPSAAQLTLIGSGSA